MLKVNKPNIVPEFWKKYIKNLTKWDELKTEVKNEFKKYSLRNEQCYNGIFLCPYCECVLQEDKLSNSTIEHIRPKSRFVKDTFNYNNLITCCNKPNQCGNYKDDTYSEESFIDPVIEDPTKYLEYSLDGYIVPIDNSIDNSINKAESTIVALNLNKLELVETRLSLFKEFSFLLNNNNSEKYDSLLDSIEGQPYYSFLLYIIENRSVLLQA